MSQKMRNNLLRIQITASYIGMSMLLGCASPALQRVDDNLRATNDPELVERGRHIVYGPGHCAYCHGDPDRESDLRAGQDIPLSGGRVFDLGMMGRIVAPNLTSDRVAGIGSLSDADLVRSLRYGISRQGRPLAPFMSFANLTDYDLRAIISFLRTLPPVQADDQNQLSLLGTFAVKVLLRPQTPKTPPRLHIEPAPTAAYGRYLAHTVANCNGCHTRRSKLTGAFVGPPFAGGMVLEEDVRTFVVPDIRPIAGGVMSALAQRDFVALFRAKGRVVNRSPMPWAAFSRMSDTELKAIYAYLSTLPPTQNAADRKHATAQGRDPQTVVRSWRSTQNRKAN